jgi:hypothetical protein
MLQGSDELQGMKRDHAIIMVGCQQQGGGILWTSNIRVRCGGLTQVTSCSLQEHVTSVSDENMKTSTGKGDKDLERGTQLG